MQEDRRSVHGRTRRQSRRGLFVLFIHCGVLLADGCLVQMLDDLVVAVESETQVVDIGRVSGFMQKVKGKLPFLAEHLPIDTMQFYSAGP